MIRYPLQPICKTFFGDSESESKMVRHSEAITWSKERPPFSNRMAELSRIAAAL
jgi:hypothetical protein